MMQETKTVDEVRAMLATPPKRERSHRDKERPIYVPYNAQAKREGDTIRLILPYPVPANSYWRHRVVQAKRGKPMAVTYLSAQAKAYRAIVAKIGENCQPFSGAVRVILRVFRQRRAGDLDGTLKVLLDSLRGIAFQDDSQILEIVATRDDDKHAPRAELEVVSLGKVEGLLFDEADDAHKAKRKRGRK